MIATRLTGIARLFKGLPLFNQASLGELTLWQKIRAIQLAPSLQPPAARGPPPAWPSKAKDASALLNQLGGFGN